MPCQATLQRQHLSCSCVALHDQESIDTVVTMTFANQPRMPGSQVPMRRSAQVAGHALECLMLLCLQMRTINTQTALCLSLWWWVLHSAGQWREASRHRELLLAYLQQESGVGTLLDTRRAREYDADNLVDQYLNQKDVQVPPWHPASPMVCKKSLVLDKPCGCHCWSLVCSKPGSSRVRSFTNLRVDGNDGYLGAKAIGILLPA